MNIEMDYNKISRALVDRLHQHVNQTHNYVEVRMTVDRCTLQSLHDAFKKTEFRRTGLQRGCRYFLSNGVVAERFDNKLAMFRLDNEHKTVIQTRVAELPSVFTNQPKVNAYVASKTMVPDNTDAAVVLRREFEGRFVFTNSRGYEYVMSVRTPSPEGRTQTLQEAEDALRHSEQQVNEFSIRFFLQDYAHSTLYHALNTLSLFIQVFNPKLELSLMLTDEAGEKQAQEEAPRVTLPAAPAVVEAK